MNEHDYRIKAYKKAAAAPAGSADENVPDGVPRAPLFQNVNRQIGQIFDESEKRSSAASSAPRAASPASASASAPGDARAKAHRSGEPVRDFTRHGLVKVPVSPQNADGKENMYRRVAKFLLLIGVDEAAKVISHLTPEQTEKIIPEIASIRRVDPDESSVILAEFQTLLDSSREKGGVTTARTILEKAFGADRAEQMLKKTVPFADGVPFDYMQDMDGERVFFLLKDESAPVRALVLSRLKPPVAADVINRMSAADKKDTVCRLAKLAPVAPDILRRIDQAMHEKVLAVNTAAADSLDGRGALAEILKRMSPDAEKDILSSLAEEDPDLGQDLRERLFTIDDVVRADDRYIQKQLQLMAESDIAYLIAGKPEPFRQKILSNISKTRGDIVLEEEQIKKPMRRTDCDEATNRFFGILRRAWENGTLVISGRDDDVYV